MRIYLILVLLLLIGNHKAFSQDENFKQYRFFIGVSPYMVGGYPTNLNASYEGFGLQGVIGNNWYLNRGKFHGLLKLTWLRGGIHLGNISGSGGAIFFSPLNVGLGHQFQINNNMAITPTVSVGGLAYAQDIIVDYAYKLAVVSEIAFEINNLSWVIEYGQRPYLGFENPYQGVDHQSFAGYTRFFSAGVRLCF